MHHPTDRAKHVQFTSGTNMTRLMHSQERTKLKIETMADQLSFYHYQKSPHIDVVYTSYVASLVFFEPGCVCINTTELPELTIEYQFVKIHREAFTLSLKIYKYFFVISTLKRVCISTASNRALLDAQIHTRTKCTLKSQSRKRME